MRSFFYSLLGYFLTPAGLLVMGALDSSLIFFLPLGIDSVSYTHLTLPTIYSV